MMGGNYYVYSFVQIFIGILDVASLFLASLVLSPHYTFSNSINAGFAYIPTVILILLMGARCNDATTEKIIHSMPFKIVRWLTLAYVVFYRFFIVHHHSNIVIESSWSVIITILLSMTFFGSLNDSKDNSPYSTITPLVLLAGCIVIPKLSSLFSFVTECNDGEFYNFQYFRNAFQSEGLIDCDGEATEIVKKVMGVVAKLGFIFNAMVLTNKSFNEIKQEDELDDSTSGLMKLPGTKQQVKGRGGIDFELHVIKTLMITCLAFLIASPHQTLSAHERHSTSILASALIFLCVIVIFYLSTNRDEGRDKRNSQLCNAVSSTLALTLNLGEQVIGEALRYITFHA